MPFLATFHSDPLSVSAPQRLPQRLSRSPKSLQSPAVGRFPQLLERPLSYLPDALARDPHQRPDLLERHRLAAFFETVVEVEDLALARREILLEDAVDELAHQLAVGLFLDLAAFLTGEALAQGGGVLVAPVHGGVERQLRRRHAARRSEEHTSELQSLAYLVCRLLLEKKK